MGSEFVNLISTVGFPIAACMALYYQSIKQQSAMSELTDKMMEVVNSNTEALTKMTAQLAEVEKGVENHVCIPDTGCDNP